MLVTNGTNPLWVERYRPNKIKDVILPKELKQTFQGIVDSGNVPNLLLSGKSGTGKTTVAKAMLEELGCDYVVINASLDRNIDTLRNEIMQYATSLSIEGLGRKVVILDEADHLNPNTFQPALRNFMEEFSGNCGFILTCNYKHKIIDALKSRCSQIEFRIPSDEKQPLILKFVKRLSEILDNEKVEYDNKALLVLATKFFPDWRKIIGEAQKYSISGRIDSGIVANITESSISELVEFLKKKEFTKIRQWVANTDLDPPEIYSTLYRMVDKIVEPSSIPILILILAKYQYQNSFSADPEINTASCMAEILGSVVFKK